MNKTIFSLAAREIVGKSVKRLRAERQIPVNIIVPHEDSIAAVAEYQPFVSLYKKVGDTGLVYVTINGDKTNRPTLIEDVQKDPVTDAVLHVVFKQVNLKEKIKAAVPVEVVGESAVPDANIVEVVSEVEVEALPTDLPEKFVIDASTLVEVGQMITFADLEFDKSLVTLMVSEEEMSSPVVMLQAQAAEEPEAPAEESTEAGTAEAAPAAEGDAKAE